MRKNKQKKKRRNSFIILAACLVFVCYFTFTIVDQQSNIKAASQEKEQLQNQLNEQLLENEELSRLIEEGEEADYMERIAREKLGYVMPDERVFYDISGS